MSVLAKAMIDFLCIGAQKAGTTWLMGNLSRHPEVWTPRFIKELHYFDKLHLGYKRDMIAAYTKRGARIAAKNPKFAEYFAKVVDPSFVFTDDWYRHVFSGGPKRKKKGECTPLYCALPDKGVRHVHRLAPKAAIIYMVRDPHERAMSSLRMEMEFSKISHSDEMADFLSEPLFAARGSYSKNITKWDEIYGAERILYIPFGDVKSQPELVMRKVEAHLGLSKHDAYPRLHDRINKTVINDKIITSETEHLIRNMVAEETEFLERRFGRDFVARTR